MCLRSSKKGILSVFETNLFFIRILPRTFYISEAYRYFQPHSIFPTSTDTSYHIRYCPTHTDLLSHLIFPRHTDTFYHILYLRSIQILPTTFDISDANRHFLPHFIFPTHTDTSYIILYFRRIPMILTTFCIYDAYLYFLTHFIFQCIPILSTTSYIFEGYRYFLSSFIFPTHTDTSYHIW